MSEENIPNSGAGIPDSETIRPETTQVKKKKKPSKIAKYILKHKVSFSLLFALIVVFIWAQWQIRSLQKEQQALVAQHEQRIDSLKQADLLALSDVFSWAIRSDLMRNNFDQANQYLLKLVQENSDVSKAYVVDAESNSIILSSDPSEIGKPIVDVLLLKVDKSTIIASKEIKRYVSPVTGFNKTIGISVIEN